MIKSNVGLLTEDRVPMFPQRPMLFWLLLCGAAIGGSFWMSFLVVDQKSYLGVCWSLGAGFITVPLAFKACHNIFLNWGRSVDEFMDVGKRELQPWFDRSMKFFEGSGLMLGLGAALGIISAVAFYFGGYFSGVPLGPLLVALAIVFGSASLAGIGLCAMVGASLAVWNLGNETNAKVTVDSTPFGVRRTGITLAKCWLIIGGVWFVYTLSALFGPHDFGSMDWLFSPPMLLLAIPTLPMILGTFLVCQFPLHHRMVEFKREELAQVDLLLAQLKPTQLEDLTEKARDSIEFLHRRRTDILALPEWPFDGRAFAELGTSLLTALLPAISGLFKTLLRSAPDIAPPF